MNEILIRPSTPEDIEALCHYRTPVSLRSFTVLLDGTPVCIAGITLASKPIVFSDFSRPQGVPKKTIYRYARMLLAHLRDLNIPATTTALEGRSRFLESLGLELAYRRGNHYFYRI